MSFTLNITDFLRLRELIEKASGIAVDDNKQYLIEGRLMKLIIDNELMGYSDLYLKANRPENKALLDQVVDVMTTNETLWFRDAKPFEVLSNHLYPAFDDEFRQGKRSRLSIWSAAASTGQEPYSIAMLAHEHVRGGGHPKLANGGMSIFASDISTTALEKAKTAEYDSLSMKRGMPDHLRTQYFTESEAACQLNPAIQSMVTFQQRNLMESFERLGPFDIVMLRNVAIYFSTESKIDLFRRLTRVMSPGGYLFLGSSESLMGVSTDFDRLDLDGCTVYQVKSGS